MVEAYLLLQGKELATSQNVEKVVENINGKMDKLIDGLMPKAKKE